jgi:hypothetical protein
MKKTIISIVIIALGYLVIKPLFAADKKPLREQKMPTEAELMQYTQPKACEIGRK